MDIWKFTHFTSDKYLFHEKWDRNNHNLKEEIMMVMHNFDPLMGIGRMEKSTHYGSRNAWYHYKKSVDKIILFKVSNIIEVWPTAENMDKPYVKPHHVFECWR